MTTSKNTATKSAARNQNPNRLIGRTVYTYDWGTATLIAYDAASDTFTFQLEDEGTNGDVRGWLDWDGFETHTPEGRSWDHTPAEGWTKPLAA